MYDGSLLTKDWHTVHRTLCLINWIKINYNTWLCCNAEMGIGNVGPLSRTYKFKYASNSIVCINFNESDHKSNSLYMSYLATTNRPPGVVENTPPSTGVAYPKNNPTNDSATFAAAAHRNTVRVEDILFEPGRSNRPQKWVHNLKSIVMTFEKPLHLLIPSFTEL